MTKVKICGITNKEDGRAAVEAGAHALGSIINVESPREVGVEEAKEIFKEVPILVSSVAVLIPSSLEEVEDVAGEINPDVIQLHGKESVEFVSRVRERIGQKIIKAIPVDENALEKAKRFSKVVDGVLLDTKAKGKKGGTGETHDWEISQEIREMSPKPVILSGGLKPENVEEGIEKVHPYAVDVSSGIESRPGKKDVERMKKFIEKVEKENGRR